MKRWRRGLFVGASVLFALGCGRGALRDSPERELSDAELREIASAPFDAAAVMNQSFAVGRHRGHPVRIDFPCGDVCPAYTTQVVRYDLAAETCPREGEVVTLGVPGGAAVHLKDFCVPRVLSVKGLTRPSSVASVSSASPSPTPSPTPSRATALPPLSAKWLEPLDLGDGASAVVSVPIGATGQRPLVVAVHGAHDRPEWACGGWRLGFRVYPFIVCPRGSAVTADKYAWANSAAIERVVMKSIDQVRQRFGPYVAPAPYVYAGFSQGAMFSEPILVEHAALFSTAILAEGGYPILGSAEFARKFKAGGGQTVVIVCGSEGCRRATRPSVSRLEAAGLRVFESGDVRSGHNLNQLMQRALERDFPSWFAGVPAWAGAMN
jgi:predicted esterase